MRKYILNIERLYTGQTANALVLNQVDDEMPTLIPTIGEDVEDIPAFIHKWRQVYPDFNPPSSIDLNQLNKYIIEFNLDLQNKFKQRGHSELYLMDDTQWMRPDPHNANFATDKVNMHLLNGQTLKDTDETDDDGQPIQEVVNSSQLNVLFPYKKISSKSLFSEQLSVESPYELDGKMERSRQMSLQGKVTSENCYCGAAMVGNNLYIMSPLVEGETPPENLLANGMTIVNSFMENPYHFPHTMTLFQPSKDRYDDSNLAKDNNGLTPFIIWYNNHNRRTVVSQLDEYGENISNFTYLGAGSYTIELATYSPTELVLEQGEKKKEIPLDADKFREIRAETDRDNKYSEFTETGDDGTEKKVMKYVFDNSILDDGENFAKVGFKFNLFDNFISGQERTLKIAVPRDTDFNKLHLKFTCNVNHDSNLLGDFDYIVYDGDVEKFRYSRSGRNEDKTDQEVDIPILDAVFDKHEFNIRVVVNYAVDFHKRNTYKEYQESLKSSGLTLMDIRVDNDVVDTKRQLTFADYVNEADLTEEEHEQRISQFWQVSQYKRDIPYQLVLETSLKNMISSGVAYPNNYSTGDMYGDVFATKSMLDPRYDMNLRLDDWYDDERRWATEEEKNDKEMKEYLTKMIRAVGREYIDIDQCSNQLFLLFKPTDLAIGFEDKWRDTDGDGELDPDNRIVAKKGCASTPYSEAPTMKFRMVEVVRNINKFESAIKHKPNVFSVVVHNSNLAVDPTVDPGNGD